MKCYNCGHDYAAHNGSLAICDEYIGAFTVHNLAYMMCGQCGDKRYTPAAAKQIENSRNAALSAVILSHPIKNFISSSEAASMLGISRQALHKHRRIRRGFIFQTQFDGKKVYLKESVLRFKQTGDGRFPINIPSVDTTYSGWHKTAPNFLWSGLLAESLPNMTKASISPKLQTKEFAYGRS